MPVTDLHFSTSFVALRALVREIIINIIIPTNYPATHISTYMTEIGFLSILNLLNLSILYVLIVWFWMH